MFVEVCHLLQWFIYGFNLMKSGNKGASDKTQQLCIIRRIGCHSTIFAVVCPNNNCFSRRIVRNLTLSDPEIQLINNNKVILWANFRSNIYARDLSDGLTSTPDDLRPASRAYLRKALYQPSQTVNQFAFRWRGLNKYWMLNEGSTAKPRLVRFN